MKKLFCLLAGAIHLCATGYGQVTATIHVNTATTANKVSPTLHGVFFEEISHAGEGGLYAELIQNRGFEECRIPAGTTLQNGFLVPDTTRPHFMLEPAKTDWKLEWPLKSDWPAWSMQSTGNNKMSLSLTQSQPLNKATPNNLCVWMQAYDATGKASVVNEGFWGINTVKDHKYHLSFYAHTSADYKGGLTVTLQSKKGAVLASYHFSNVKGKEWRKYTCDLLATADDGEAQFAMSFESAGKVWLDFVSLFPDNTFNNRPNGLRKDIAGLIAGMKPSFIRWPGGCFVEGITIESAPDWKKTIGPVEERPGTFSPWGYWSSDGLGYHEYLQFCEDVHADALYVFNVGVSCEYRSGTYVPESELQPYIQNALDAIEYAIGPVTSTWGRLRAKNGHPKPFPLKYVEIGNEQHGPKYARRYNLFYDAIRAKYPNIVTIASMGIGDVNRHTLDSMKQVQIADEHAYKDANWIFRNTDHFDRYKRGNWDMYVGEYATNAGVGAGNMQAALSDAIYVMSMERNADLVKMSSYAPLLVNENDVDWPVNLIHYTASQSFARISYYAINLLAENKADINIPAKVTIQPKSKETAAFAGGVGLGTWDTQTEFANVKITQNGAVVYSSDFAARPGEWKPIRGNWNYTDSGALAQTAMGEQLLALLAGKSFDNYTITLQARRTGGINAFLIPFAVKDSNTYLRAHIGSWYNSHCVFESVTNGYDVAGLTNQFPLAGKLENNKWYNVKLEVGKEDVKCYLDDKLLMTYREPEKLFALAGKDTTNGDVIVKVVNAYETPASIQLNFDDGFTATEEVAVLQLSANKTTDENSYQRPQAFVPVASVVSSMELKHPWTCKPLSITVLRFKRK
ncbi:Alpha-L-arabinofuranosidase C-terminus [Filimonas lacunae]|uniref:non-reducing end alpha-L-arabinofuranosidase n=1 Tax=Filimonas lacunae TaxID=477680 RepID=A0A173MRJ3_9BACT|nr:alpha-L-arabinofuranosidase C-terminal domain-containing protein [Filimonas lacunae]BAV10274.1 alpha-N-acetylglucosaminidase [Filimonas lacunae]SIT17596.1 Alpha-L-arabinofuranosidase C-terminus [Filimonas lacunae]